MRYDCTWPLAAMVCCALFGTDANAQFRIFQARPGGAYQAPLRSQRAEQRQERREQEAPAPAFKPPTDPPPAVAGLVTTPSSGEVDDTFQLVERAIDLTSRRQLDADKFTPWQIMHALLALRGDLTLVKDGQSVNAIDWISDGARFWNTSDPALRGTYWFEATPYGGRAQKFNGTPYEFEGHSNQSLAIMAMSNLPLDHKFKVADNRTLTMADMVRHAQMSVSKDEEITWTLWFLTQYLDPDSQWTNAKGERWSMEYLVQLQIQSEVTKAPCGGTHGLFALAYIRNSYLQKHGNLRGIWLSADMKIQQHIAMSKALQNDDGSFSTMHFKGRGQSDEFGQRINYSGHQLEWLMMALPQQRLEEEWVQRGLRTLATDLIDNATQAAECGPLYHSLNALKMYRARVAPAQTETAPEQLAQKPETTTEQTDAAPRTLPAIEAQPVAMRPMTPEATTEKGEDAIVRPVPEPVSLVPVTPVPSVASAKPAIDAPPEATKSPVAALAQPARPIQISPGTSAPPLTTQEPTRVASLPETNEATVAPLKPATEAEAPTTPMPAVERPSAAAAPQSPASEMPAEIGEPQAEASAPATGVSLSRPFLPLAPTKLKQSKRTDLLNVVPQE